MLNKAVKEKKSLTIVVLIASVQLIGIFCAFIMQVVVSKFSSSRDAYGDITYNLSWMFILSSICTLGLPQAVVRYIPEISIKYDSEHSLHLASNFLKWTLILSFILMLFFSLLYGLISSQKIPYLIFSSVFLLASVQLLSALFMSLKKNFMALIPIKILQPLLLVIFILSIVDLGELRVTNFSYLLFFSLIFVFLMLMYFFQKNYVQSIKVSQKFRNDYSLTQISKVSIPILVSTFLGMTLNYIDVIFLQNFIGPVESGTFFTALKISAIGSLPLLAINQLAPIEYSKGFAEKKLSHLKLLGRRYAVLSLILSLPLFLILFIFRIDLLQLFDSTYATAEHILGILLFSQLVNCLTGSVLWILNSTGNHYKCILSLGVCVILNIILNFLFIPQYGLEGAVLSSSFSMIVWNGMSLFWVRKSLNFDPSILSLVKNA